MGVRVEVVVKSGSAFRIAAGPECGGKTNGRTGNIRRRASSEGSLKHLERRLYYTPTFRSTRTHTNKRARQL